MKIGYVSTKMGELDLFLDMGPRPRIQVSLNPQIPQIPRYNLSVEIESTKDFRQICRMATLALLTDVTGFLNGQGINPETIEKLHKSVMQSLDKELSEIDGEFQERGALENALESEPFQLLEIEFELPEEFFSDVYKNIVTAATEYRRTERAKPYKRDHGTKFDNLDLNTVNPKKTIEQYRNNVFKHTPSKNYILTYDINGRPTGMIEAPRFPINYKSKLLK
jgi:hypothetical protein